MFRVVQVVRQQQCNGHCLSDSAGAQQLKEQLRSAQVAGQWRCPLPFHCSGGGPRSLRSYSGGFRGRAFTLSSPSQQHEGRVHRLQNRRSSLQVGDDQLQQDVRYVSQKCELFDGQCANLCNWKETLSEHWQSWSRFPAGTKKKRKKNAACVTKVIEPLNRFYSSSKTWTSDDVDCTDGRAIYRTEAEKRKKGAGIHPQHSCGFRPDRATKLCASRGDIRNGRLHYNTGAVWKSRCPSWVTVPNKPTVSVDTQPTTTTTNPFHAAPIPRSRWTPTRRPDSPCAEGTGRATASIYYTRAFRTAGTRRRPATILQQQKEQRPRLTADVSTTPTPTPHSCPPSLFVKLVQPPSPPDTSESLRQTRTLVSTRHSHFILRLSPVRDCPSPSWDWLSPCRDHRHSPTSPEFVSRQSEAVPMKEIAPWQSETVYLQLETLSRQPQTPSREAVPAPISPTPHLSPRPSLVSPPPLVNRPTLVSPRLLFSSQSSPRHLELSLCWSEANAHQPNPASSQLHVGERQADSSPGQTYSSPAQFQSALNCKHWFTTSFDDSPKIAFRLKVPESDARSVSLPVTSRTLATRSTWLGTLTPRYPPQHHRWQPHWLPDWRHFREVTWLMEIPRLVVSASLQKIKSIEPNQTKIFIFYFIKSETSDSFVSHLDGHFAYLKTLDF